MVEVVPELDTIGMKVCVVEVETCNNLLAWPVHPP